MRRFLEFRDAVGEDRFVDVGQPELQADPVGVADRIYDFAGLELTDELRTAMAEWSHANQAGSRGEHSYRAEEFGLTDDADPRGLRRVPRAVRWLLRHDYVIM